MRRIHRWQVCTLLVAFGLIFSLMGGCQCGPPSTGETTPAEGQQQEGPTGDLSKDSAPPETPKVDVSPQQCSSVCDCTQGEDCQRGRCVREPGLVPVYCCDKPGCVAGQKCFFKDGREDVCTSAACQASEQCGKPTCQQSGDNCMNLNPTCLNGACVTQPAPVQNAVCDTAQGRCKARTPNQCTQHCECAQGQYCDKGKCTTSDNPVYCCDKPGCPAQAACFKADGSVGACTGTLCKSNTDCGRLSCSVTPDGNCIETTPTCRDDGTCIANTKRLAGATCNAEQRCVQQQQPCKTHCDCQQGFTCVQGFCYSLSSRQSFCCFKEGCPSGKACFKGDGSPGVCGEATCKQDSECGKKTCRERGDSNDCEQVTPSCTNGKCASTAQLFKEARCDSSSGSCIPRPSECKLHCDCPQGQGCFNGKCGVAPNGAPTYCCDKPGCAAGKACQSKDGTLGTCPNTKCQKDADCGNPTCADKGNDCETTTRTCDLNTGNCISKTATTQNASCQNGKCAPKQATCSTSHCDCPQGQYCYNGKCETTTYPLYCCDTSGCPAGNRCWTRNGQPQFCPTPCKSPCDCAEGEACTSGKCVATTQPVYCCSRTQACPAGKACKDQSGQDGTCPNQPRTCKTACDCIQGEDCVNGTCTQGSAPVYCCSKNNCPVGKQCLDKAGLQGTCPQTCNVHCDCPQGTACLDGKCTKDPLIGTTYCCDKPGCPLNQFCYQRNGQGGRCQARRCSTACDCTQGEDCRNGYCIPTQPPVYCCDKDGCAQGASCKDKTGKWGTCAAKPTCKSPCDCPQGQDCYKGQCVALFPAVYCCSNTGCPLGQACYDSNNTAGTCPGNPCKTACDCPVQGQSCVRGACVYLDSGSRVYCCDKQYCPAGNRCEDKQGNLKTCSQTSCTTPCDCNQGEDCRNGACILVSPAVYCCSKLGCPPNQPCSTNTGATSQCR